MSKAPTENQKLQAVSPRPWDTVIDLSQQPSDWLAPKGKVRAKKFERMQQRRAERAAQLKQENLASVNARRARQAERRSTRDYDPDQPRDPGGEGGGQWIAEGGGGGGGGGAVEKRAQRAPKAAQTPAAPKARATPSATGTHSYPKPKIGGTKAGSHAAKISPSVTSTKFRTENSDTTYVPTGLAQMQKTEAEVVERGVSQGKGRFTANMELMHDRRFYPGMRPSMLRGGANRIARNAIEHMKTNMRFLLGKASAAQRGGVNWYRGARKIVDNKVRQHKLNDASVAGVYAALSPQKDWDVNIYLGDRLIDIYVSKQQHAWDDGMQAWADRLIADEEKAAAKKLAQSGKAKKTPPMVKLLPLIMNKRLSECDSAEEKGLWIRAYEEAHGDPEQNGGHGYKVYNPDGSFGAFHTNIPEKGETVGRVAKAGWNNTKAVGAAVAALEANGDRVKISEALSQVHKVRNFYNNILDPDGPDGDVTMDTHAIGAAWLQPYPGGAPAVAHGLANNPTKLPEGWVPAQDSNRHGSFGTYGLYAEAYRELAAEQQPPLLPNQLQAVVWVVKRDLFGNLSKADEAKIDTLWQDYRDGKLAVEQVQNAVWEVGEAANARKQQA